MPLAKVLAITVPDARAPLPSPPLAIRNRLIDPEAKLPLTTAPSPMSPERIAPEAMWGQPTTPDAMLPERTAALAIRPEITPPEEFPINPLARLVAEMVPLPMAPLCNPPLWTWTLPN